MDPQLLHSIVTNASVECMQVLTSIPIETQHEPLIRQLATCSIHCVECGQGCQLGTCLPETIERCRDACLSTERMLRSGRSQLDIKDSTFKVLNECVAACAER